MDYKYINQLLDRYWRCETTLKEENILRAFFSQSDIPAELRPYQDLFRYEQTEPEMDVLGNDFDEKMLARIEGDEPVKAKVVTMPHRLRPLFKAAAVVAIILTLGNAMQVPFEHRSSDPISEYDGYDRPEMLKTSSVAMGDSAATDTLHQSIVGREMTQAPIIK